MRLKSVLTLIAWFFFGHVFAQTFTVTGKITDKATGNPLQGASVFCQNTTFGTATGAAGDFILYLPNGGYDLVISFSGFETYSQRINASTENINSLAIALKQKDKSLEEVSITVTNEVKDGWVKYGEFFKDQFIGMTENSQKCVIENPDALKFFFSKKKNRLKVSSKEDIRITNKALGYTIRYQLDSFIHEYGTGLTQTTGIPFFEELHGSEEDSLAWEKNREKAYYGSVLHFMRCYYDSTLGENGYKLELVNSGSGKTRGVNNPYDSSFFQVADNNDVELNFPGKLRVAYKEEKPEAKYLTLNKLSPGTTIQISIVDFADAITIEQNGYFYDQKDILSLGYWSWEKLGDFLPYNYEPRQ